MNIAIQGHPTRGKEVIQILKSLGATSYNIYDKCSHPEWYWYINKNKEITCDPKKSIQGYKLYTLEEFKKIFPFKIGDRIISLTTGLIGTITTFSENGIYHFKYDNGIYSFAIAKYLKLYKEMKEERNITLTLDKAKEWYNKGGELKEVALQAYSEEELSKVDLPKTWEEFCNNYPKKKGMSYIYVDSTIKVVSYHLKNFMDKNADKNICPSQKSAEVHLAMMQLEQLRDCWRQGWKPNWNDSQQNKYCVCCYEEEFQIAKLWKTKRFLSFPTEEMAKEFLKCFKDLIKKAGDLI